jgi:tetratricopeptide (TPR) repeat protein
MRKIQLCLIVIIGFSLISAIHVFAQSEQELAKEKADQAIKLMDDGKLDESIVLLQEAQALDKEEWTYPYEIAMATYMKKDFPAAIIILEDLAANNNVNDRVFQLLGNAYSNLGKPEEATAKYDAGLEKFPSSGLLFMEKGTLALMQKNYDQAANFYEKGIEVDPLFPSNYYRVAALYLNSNFVLWGMIYGELFMNLERNTQRTAEMSKALYNAYKTEIKFGDDKSFSFSFCKIP